jgi:hypothetical protein
MMKKIVILTLAMLMAAGTAFALESTLTGRFIFEGSYYDNYIPSYGSIYGAVDSGTSFKADNTYKFMDYDMDWRINWKLQITPSTKVMTRITMHDETLGLKTDGNGGWNGAVPGAIDANGNFVGGGLDDNIAIERAYISQALSPKTVLEAGLMAGGAWSTNFGNTGLDVYKVTIMQAALGPFQAVGFQLEKDSEQGSRPVNQAAYAAAEAAAPGSGVIAEQDDWDKYVLWGITKLGPVTLYPLLAYQTRGHYIIDEDNSDMVVGSFLLGATGATDLIGWEAEGSINSFSFSDSFKFAFGDQTSATTFGLYGNVWFNLDMAKIGLWLAYGSVDEDSGLEYSFGDDFDSSMIIGDDLGGTTDLTGATAGALYADFTPMEKLTITPKVMYFSSNVEENGTTGFEIDLWGLYQLTDEVKYTVGFGYATIDIELAGVTTESDPAFKLYHELRLDF